MQVTIDTENRSGRIRNFWNHIHFHPTDAVEDRWGKEILDRVAADKVAEYVRLHTMFEDLVRRGEHGELVFDFSDTDRRLDSMVSRGFKLLLCFDFMPPCMSSDLRNVSNLRYKNKTFNRSAPVDWEEWRKVCEVYTRHLAERYGMETLSRWQFHCWNEPDSGYWLTPAGNDQADSNGETEIKLAEYLKLYDFFESGVSAVDRRIRVGGPSCAGSDRFIRQFLEHTASGRNHVSGTIGTRLDFIGVHCYSQGIYSNLPNRSFTSPDNILQRLKTVRAIADETGHAETPLLLDEFGIAGGGWIGIDRDPRMIFRETEYHSAFYIRLMERILAAPELKVEKMMICLSGQEHGIRDFDGFRTFFTANGFAKPVYNAYRLAAKLEGEAPACRIEGKNEHCGITSALSEEGTLRILLSCFEDDFYKTAESVPVRLEITGLRGKYRLRHSRIDKQFSNAFSKWAEMGSPPAPTMYQRSKIADAGELQPYSPEEVIFADGVFARDLVMTHNAVSLLEFLPEQGGCREGETGKGRFSHASGGSPADNGRKTVS